jgi:8-oxo-dGTP pyrophosphatase MutT (NUDIX family)
MSKSPHSPSRWIRRDSRVVAKTAIFDLLGVTYHHPVRETTREFVCIDAPDWVNVVAITKQGQVIMVRQFRYGTNDFSTEIPGGVMEKGEDPVTAGARELAEETGYAGKASLLGSLHPNPAFQNNRFHAVLVEDAELVHPLDWDADEELSCSLMSLPELQQAILEGRVTHSLTVCALMLYHLRRRSA